MSTKALSSLKRNLKLALFSTFQKISKFFSGKGLRGIPGVSVIYSFMFKFLWPDINTVKIQGSKMYFSNSKFASASQDCIILQNIEELTTELFKKIVKKEDIVVDIGANIGYYALLAARLVGERGRVYAFEPEPINYCSLVKNIELNKYENIIPVQMAVSDVNRMVKLNISSENLVSHTLGQNVDKNEFKESIEVESITLDKFFKDKEYSINVIKMDIEGAEPAAFLGMSTIIEKNKNLKIFTEFNFKAIEGMGYSPEKFFNKLLSKFLILAINDSTQNKRCQKIKTFDKFLKFCEVNKNKVSNLLLEKI